MKKNTYSAFEQNTEKRKKMRSVLTAAAIVLGAAMTVYALVNIGINMSMLVRGTASAVDITPEMIIDQADAVAQAGELKSASLTAEEIAPEASDGLTAAGEKIKQAEEVALIAASPEDRPENAVNPDIVGWLKVEGTGIDHPILKEPEGEIYHYLYYDYNNEPSATGSIALDIGTPLGCDYVIIHGHNAGWQGVMFTDLMNFRDQSFCDKGYTAYVTDRSGKEVQYRFALSAVVDGYSAEVFGTSMHADYLNEHALCGSITGPGRYLVLVTCLDIYDPEDTDRLVVVFKEDDTAI